MTKQFLLSIIVHFYNELEGISLFLERLLPVAQKYDYEIIFVNDGSTDKTSSLLEEFASKNKHIKVISFIRNFGHQMALMAGYDHAKGDAVITIDADLQDKPELIPELIDKWEQGYKVVYAKREERDDSYFKKQTASLFYQIINFLSDTPIPKDVGDYRLMDKQVVQFLTHLSERKDFLRGIVAWGGFKSTDVYFKRDKRTTGTTHYPLSKMIDLAMNGITSFSTKPLRMATYLGFLSSFFSVLVIVFKLIQHALFPQTYWLPGWASLFFAVVFLGGVQLITIGIIGEYIGKIYKHIQARPNYLIKDLKNI
jgi:dolichol-phosphate mannosyltransferase